MNCRILILIIKTDILDEKQKEISSVMESWVSVGHNT